MYALLDGNRTVIQLGDHPGDRDGHTAEEVSDETLAAIHAALPAHGGGVALSEDHGTVTANPEPAGAAALREDAAARVRQRADDLRTLVGHAAIPDDLKAALARLVG